MKFKIYCEGKMWLKESESCINDKSGFCSHKAAQKALDKAGLVRISFIERGGTYIIRLIK